MELGAFEAPCGQGGNVQIEIGQLGLRHARRMSNRKKCQQSSVIPAGWFSLLCLGFSCQPSSTPASLHNLDLGHSGFPFVLPGLKTLWALVFCPIMLR